ncbi:ubiquitin carboxyl-terminal hydrolase 10-like isoform X2 [Neocloeon triangulifer]|uniref:ubiquitin carboxyl-terminal hydrolase 10-like isoform X2 n=1 Tax=Neocloeon triangulifer TaxID=2078957 RepID=UPI00286EEE17|nr:ubiquitin carboxyl-terminal hydrolase 10-like isoform X2 [Neocloeon triangulifer]
MESNDKIQFIDLDGVDETECSRVQNILFGECKSISVPSRKQQPQQVQHVPPPQQQQPPLQPPPPQQMAAVPPPMVTQAQWDPHRSLEMAPAEQVPQKPILYPVVMSQASMVNPSPYSMIIPNHQNMMINTYMVPQGAAYKKDDAYGGYQQPPPQMQPHPNSALWPSYSPSYPSQPIYYQQMYMPPPQMQQEMQPPADMYLTHQQEPLNLAAKEPIIVNTEASILQPTAPAFLPSYHPPPPTVKPPAFNNNNLQLRPTAPAFKPPKQEEKKEAPPKAVTPEEPKPVKMEEPPVEVAPEPQPEPVVIDEPPPVEEEKEPEPVVVAEPKTPEPTPAPPAPATMSWARIVQAKNPPTDPVAADAAKTLPRQQPEQVSSSAVVEEENFSLAANNNNNNSINKFSNHLSANADDMSDDPFLYRLGEYLSAYVLDHRSSPLQPRGLTNRSNWCYVNATLQALVACPPFYNLMRNLPCKQRNNSKYEYKSKTPIIDAVMEFMQEFNSLPAGAKPARRDKVAARKGDDVVEVPQGPPFEPSCVYAMLGSIRSAAFKVEGRQEDAEEFLSCLLNGLNDEMLDLMKLVEGPNAKETLVNGQAHSPSPTANGNSDHGLSEDEDAWTVMKSRNRACVTRRADFGRTPVSDIFRGQLCSHVQRKGDQQTENVQPFYTLQLDIERASSVKEALEQMVDKDRLEGVTCSRTHQQVEAWQQVTLEELPPVLLLHLKWFDYKLDGCSKIMKTVDYTVDLKIENKILSHKKNNYNPKQKIYKLFAVVYHDGKEASKGHYITDAYNSNLGIWVRYDDNQVRVVPEALVLHPKSPSVPYILYYRRSDTMGQPSAKSTEQPSSAK